MNAADVTPDLNDGDDAVTDRADGPASEVTEVTEVTVRRNGVLFAAMGLVCLALALAYVVRGVGGGSGASAALSWVVAAVIAGIGVVMALSWRESRTPMVVADGFGIRVRLGQEWRGLPWASLEQVVVEPRTSVLHDGRLVVVPRDVDEALDGLDARARRQVALSHKVYGAALVVPLGMTTRVSVPRLVDALAELAGSRAAVVELAGWAPQPVVPIDVEQRERRRARGRARSETAARRAEAVESRFEREGRTFEGLAIFDDLASSVSTGVHSIGTSVSAGVTSLVARLELRRLHQPDAHDSTTVLVDGSTALALHPLDDPESLDEPNDRLGVGQDQDRDQEREQDRDQDGDQDRDDLERDRAWDVVAPDPAHSTGIEAHDPETHDCQTDEHGAEPEIEPSDPEIGPRLRRAREQLGYDVAALCERTRIQPHVIDAIERDDFAACGGDFYARGHLRAMCAVLGVPAQEVVGSFDALHASGPVDAKRVFGAELATAHPSQGLGRRWALVLCVILTLVLAWGVARLFTDEPQALSTPAVDGSAGLASQREPITSVYGPPVSMSVRGTGPASSVVVRDHTGAVMWTGTVQAGVRRQLAGVGPFEVTATDPDSVEVWVDGQDRGTVVADNAVLGKQTRTFS